VFFAFDFLPYAYPWSSVLSCPTLPSFRQPFHSTSKSKVQVPLSPHFHLDIIANSCLSVPSSPYTYILFYIHPPTSQFRIAGFFFPSRVGDLRAPLVYMYIRYMCFTPPEEEAGKLSAVSLGPKRALACLRNSVLA